MSFIKILLLGITALFCLCTKVVFALEIATASATPQEQATAAQLQALTLSHNLEKWTFTEKVYIDQQAIPHSHPILTLNTRHTGIEGVDRLLSTYLHEQIHWHLENNRERTEAAIEELKKHFKSVPVGLPDGARSQASSYLHLLVCYLEIQALSELLSKSRVAAVFYFLSHDHYRWIYRQTHERKQDIVQIINKYNLAIR